MDEALRKAERTGDWRDYATRLRHAGREHAARRVVEERASEGDAQARELLDTWYPLDGRTRSLFAELADPVNLADHRPSRLSGLPWLLLLGDPDPRCLERVRAQTPTPSGLGGWQANSVPWAVVEELWVLPFLERLVAAFEAFGPVVLERARLSSSEAVQFAQAVWGEGKEGYPFEFGIARQSAMWALGSFGDPGREVVDLVARGLTDSRWIVRFEASLARAALERRPHTDDAWGGWSGRPGWLPWRCPATQRDRLTGCLGRAVLRPPEGVSPLHPDAPRPFGWIQLDLDHFKRINDIEGCTRGDEVLAAVGEALQAVVGDRVVRWGGEVFLVCVEEDVDLRAQAERLRAAVAGAVEGLTASAGVAETHVCEEGIRRADHALFTAKRAGRDRVVVWSSSLAI